LGVEDVKSADHLSRLERLLTSAVLTAYFFSGYFSIQLWPRLDRVSEPVSVFDRLLPFSPSWIWGYVWAIPAAVMPAFIVGSRDLFRRTALAYAITITVCLALFIAMPDTAIALRPSIGRLNLERPSEWLVASVYTIDPPGNLFPSLHVALTALSMSAAWMANRTVGGVALVGLAVVAAAACLVKQHFIIDVISGLAVAAAVAVPTIGLIRRPDEHSPWWGSWRAAVYVLCVIFFYVAIGGAFTSGLRPPQGR
jgi:membrane-associated phospholipid phosphatase